ncbi:uncharacterized protein FFB20_09304 [Fusarium fujikuroi]|nr:uncharacterized protein FFC1_03742 [Fusarium fujikuroi]SCN92857.1 uncharacterized protein FFB20_09304 [Fusarium fujikuroi]SCO02938.1 uncharacterized protein FFE2_10105 [Fusarium fujikuroi]SCO08469.1 uncharacterized protein FFM5_09363 [Fusarium fujikuroi]SCO32976.1 uncharacterized protein FFNC_03196 [Fusarium fujikuroi]
MATHNGTAPAPRAPQFARRQDISVPFMSSPSFQDNPPKIDEFPRGYPSLSAFLSGDREFTMFRSFTRLHARVLLHKQDELAELEQRLDQLDQKDSKVDSYRLLTNRHSSGDTERRALLSEIEGKLNDFKRPEPEESQIKSVRNWVDGYICEIGRSESQAHQSLETGSCLTCPDHRTGCYNFGRADRSFVLSTSCPDAALYYCGLHLHLLVSTLLADVV